MVITFKGQIIITKLEEWLENEWNIIIYNEEWWTFKTWSSIKRYQNDCLWTTESDDDEETVSEQESEDDDVMESPLQQLLNEQFRTNLERQDVIQNTIKSFHVDPR